MKVVPNIFLKTKDLISKGRLSTGTSEKAFSIVSLNFLSAGPSPVKIKNFVEKRM